MARTEITRADLMALDEYGSHRAEHRRRMVELKRSRRMAVGPHAVLIFENWETMWFQIHEMLFIERGGDQQIADELHAYNPLVPKGHELVATLMIEVEEEVRRRRLLAVLGGIENHVALLVGDDRIGAVAETDVERTDASGKASSVHFLHFPFTERQIAAFRDTATRVVAAIDHPQYQHMAVMPEAVRRNLAGDFA